MSNHEGFSDPTADVAVGRAMRRQRKYAGRSVSLSPVQSGAGPRSSCADQSISRERFVGKHARKLPLVYVCSRFAGRNESEVSRHIALARQYSRFVLTKQGVPVTPHLMYPQFLRDHIPLERELGFRSALKLMEKCDELWAFVPDGISAGMRRELEQAKAKGLPVKFFDGNMQEVISVEHDL